MKDLNRLYKAFDSMYRELTFNNDPRAKELARLFNEVETLLSDYDYKPIENKVNKTTIHNGKSN